MFVKNNTLLIGKSAIIKKTFYYLYKNKKIKNLSFRKSWQNLSLIGNSKYIIISGFHFDICKMTKYELDKYVIRYSNYIYKISSKCKKVCLICTDLSSQYSFSRVVYFYYHLLKKQIKNRKLEVLSFKTIYGIEKKIDEKLKIVVLRLLGIKVIHYKDLCKNINEYKLKKNTLKFYSIKFPRSRSFDRLIRLFVDLILIKYINKFYQLLAFTKKRKNT